LDEKLAKSLVESIMVTLLSLVTMISSLNQVNSTLSGFTSEGTTIEQITSCLCPTVFWSKPPGRRKIFGEIWPKIKIKGSLHYYA